jgi:beta-lactamase class A
MDVSNDPNDSGAQSTAPVPAELSLRPPDAPTRRRHRRRKPKRRVWRLIVAGVIIGAVSVALILLVSNRPAGQQAAPARHPARADPSHRSSGPTHPAAPTPTTTATSSPSAVSSPLTSAATSYLSTRTGDITAAVYNVSTGQTWTLKPGDAQAAASMVMVDIMATLLAQVTSSGQQLSTADQNLMTTMIGHSDNDSATALWSAAGGPSGISTFNGTIGMKQTKPSTCLTCPGFSSPGWGLTTTTAVDQVDLLEHLITPNAQIGNTEQAYALNLMENVDPSDRWGVSGGVPAGVTVALKNGWVPLSDSLWQINSVGWVNGDGRDYVMAVLTDGNPSEAYGIDTINTLSGLVWKSMAPS